MALATTKVAKLTPSQTRVLGKDELNLAEFPISILKRQQFVSTDGRKQDIHSFHSKRWDRNIRAWVPQTVTLKANTEDGLPTPLDEQVFVALLHVAHQGNRFHQPKVEFVPHRLLTIMQCSPNQESYERLRQALRRLKALVITYQNAWYDPVGNQYEEEFSMGVIANYRLLRPVRGRKNDTAELSWIRWDPELFGRLRSGVLKPLDLDKLFSLELPISRRMFRFLDRHFHKSPALEMDLRDFACGHIGLSERYDIGKLKSKLAPAIIELEARQVVEPASRQERYHKLKPGVWRVRFHKKVPQRDADQQSQQPDAIGLLAQELTKRRVTPTTARAIATQYPAGRITAKIEAFDWLLQRRDSRVSKNPAGYLVKSIQDDYAAPHGFATKAQLVASHQEQQRRAEAERLRRQRTEQHHIQQEAEQLQFRTTWKPVWDALPPSEQDAIRQHITGNNRYLTLASGLVEAMCLHELARRSGETPKNNSEKELPEAGNG